MPQMEKKYRVEGTARQRGITGISMGGYGALRLAFKYPNDFAAVSAQMPALMADIPENLSAGGPGSPTGTMGEVFGSPFNRAYFGAQQCVHVCQERYRRRIEAAEDLLRCGQQ